MRFADWILDACSALGLNAEIGFRVVLPNGQDLVAAARIEHLGAPNGMLVFHAYNEFRDYAQMLVDAGYGFSVLDEPRPDEELDLASVQDMFRDWGWSGEPEKAPPWMEG